jgi:hypothetical protein
MDRSTLYWPIGAGKLKSDAVGCDSESIAFPITNFLMESALTSDETAGCRQRTQRETHFNMASVQHIWCIGSARFVKEISPLIDCYAHVKWIADGPALARNLAVASEFVAAIVDHNADGTAINHLKQVHARFPRTRSLVIVDACDLRTLRDYLDTGAATEIVYRPLERIALLRSCGLAAAAASKAPTPSKSSSPA